MWNLKYDTMKLSMKEIHTENRLVVAKGEGEQRRTEWEFGVSRCKLLYTEWINNNV